MIGAFCALHDCILLFWYNFLMLRIRCMIGAFCALNDCRLLFWYNFFCYLAYVYFTMRKCSIKGASFDDIKINYCFNKWPNI